MDKSDELLFARYLREGDDGNLRALLQRYRERLTLFLFGYMHKMGDAEELRPDVRARRRAATLTVA